MLYDYIEELGTPREIEEKVAREISDEFGCFGLQVQQKPTNLGDVEVLHQGG